MKKYNFLNLAILISYMSLSSCEDMNQAQFQHAYTDVANESSPDARQAMDELTRGGRTLPSGRELTEAVSNPGNCDSCNALRNPVVATSNQPNYYPTSLKNYPIPSAGCIPVSSVSEAEASALIRSQGLTTQNATSSERRTLGATIKRVQELNGGPLRMGMGPGGNYAFNFKNSNGSWQGGDAIHIGRGSHDHGNSVAQHAHEWAHLIGNQGGYAMFKRYMGGSGGYSRSDHCLVSGYADNVTSSGRIEGEQFAEVFAAFVTQPSLLLNNTQTPGNCRKVYNFFKDHFFARGSRVRSCQ